MAIGPRNVSIAVFGAGALLFAGGFAHRWLGERAFARVRETTCTVDHRRIDLGLLRESGGRRRGPPRARGYREQAHLVLWHEVDGARYAFAEEFLRDWKDYASLGFEEGKAYPCRYDPENP